MFILFTLVFMRMSGAVVFNPILGRTNYPRMAKGALIFVLSLMMYAGVGGTLNHQPVNMLEYGIMLVKELMVGLFKRGNDIRFFNKYWRCISCIS